MPEEVLRAQLGEALTAQLIDLAHGRDERPVVPDREAKSIGHEETFGSDLADAEVLHAELVRMTDIVTSRIRSGVGGARHGQSRFGFLTSPLWRVHTRGRPRLRQPRR